MPDFLLLNIYSPDSLPSPTRTLAEKQHAQREHNKMNSMKNARSWVKTVYLASIIVISEGFSTRVHIIFRSQEKPSLDLSLQSSSCTSWRRASFKGEERTVGILEIIKCLPKMSWQILKPWTDHGLAKSPNCSNPKHMQETPMQLLRENDKMK